MNWKKIAFYLFAPLGVALPMVFMYFSGVEALQHIVSPNIEGLYGNSNRELGLLENLQNAVLLTFIVILIRALIREKSLNTIVPLALVTLLAGFVFLEEIDYGLHYYEYFAGVGAQEAELDRNWHNVGDRTSQTKRIVDVAMVIAFLIAPFALHGSNFPAVRLLTPDKYAALTLLAMVIVRTTAHGLQDTGFGDPGTMDKNLSEFRELITYYLVTAYLFELCERRLPSRKPAAPQH